MAESRPSKRRAATTSAILVATGELIAERGVDGFTLSEVSRRAKINRALIYHYFQNRDNLIVQAIDDIITRNEGPGKGLNADSVESSLRLHIAHPEISRVLFQLMLNKRPLLRLGARITDTVDAIDRYEREHGAKMPYDITFSLIFLVMAQLSWPIARESIAELLKMSPEEADERFINTARWATDLAMSTIPPAPTD